MERLVARNSAARRAKERRSGGRSRLRFSPVRAVTREPVQNSAHPLQPWLNCQSLQLSIERAR
eukprot:3331035-Pleurochrysis_carterae.AAC.3